MWIYDAEKRYILPSTEDHSPSEQLMADQYPFSWFCARHLKWKPRWLDSLGKFLRKHPRWKCLFKIPRNRPWHQGRVFVPSSVHVPGHRLSGTLMMGLREGFTPPSEEGKVWSWPRCWTGAVGSAGVITITVGLMFRVCWIDSWMSQIIRMNVLSIGEA